MGNIKKTSGLGAPAGEDLALLPVMIGILFGGCLKLKKVRGREGRARKPGRKEGKCPKG